VLNKGMFVEYVYTDTIVQINVPPFIDYLRASANEAPAPKKDKGM
jgi:hypothetical protein